MTELVISRRDGYVQEIRLNRPEKRNALSADLCNAIADAVDEVTRIADQSADIRAILIRGEGKAFCAGADLAGGVYTDDFHEGLNRMLGSILACPVAVIADIQGPAVGAGTQIALACDLRVVGDDGWFMVPPAKLGIALDNWTIRRAVDMLGGSVARSVLLGAARVSADRAWEVGFANVRGDAQTALNYAHEIADHAPISIRQLKFVLNDEGFTFGLREDHQELYDRAWSSADATEAREARKEKRPPKFVGK